MKGNKMLYLFYAIFGLSGIGMLIGGMIFLVKSIQFHEKAVEITAVISEIETYRDSDGDRRHNVYVDYVYEGEVYQDVYLHEYNSSMYEGKEITLLCDPDNPGKVDTPMGGYFTGGLLIFMGVIFGAIGIIPPIVTGNKTKMQKRLLSEGRVLHGVVERVEYDRSVRVNGRYPYVVYCMYRDEYQDLTYKFKSNHIWSDPTAYFPEGSDIEIYVQVDDYSKYYVDVDRRMDGKVVDFT